jgi:hypothetical protein
MSFITHRCRTLWELIFYKDGKQHPLCWTVDDYLKSAVRVIAVRELVARRWKSEGQWGDRNRTVMDSWSFPRTGPPIKYRSPCRADWQRYCAVLTSGALHTLKIRYSCLIQQARVYSHFRPTYIFKYGAVTPLPYPVNAYPDTSFTISYPIL